jgi:hypothetical protein
MDFINQVKKLKELTKSPEVRQICEKYLTGSDEVSKEQVEAVINEQESPESKSHWDAIAQEQMQASKKAAQALMESWGSYGKKSSNAGSYVTSKEEAVESASLLENLNSIQAEDQNVKSFVEAQNLRKLGIVESIQKIKGLSISEYPKVRIVCEQYSNLIVNKSVPEFALIHGFIAELEAFKWDVSILPILDGLKDKSEVLSREIEVAKVLESIKNSGSASFYSELSESLNSWLISENKSSGLLAKEITRWSFNPVVRNLVNFLNVNEASNSMKLELPVKAQNESKVGRIFSPILIEGDATLFTAGNSIFRISDNELIRLSEKEVAAVPSEYITLVNACLRPYVQMSESGISIRLGKKSVSLVEEGENVSVYLGKSRLNFRSVGELAKILGMESGNHFGVNESQVVGDIINIYSNFKNIVELDFAKNITSNIYEGVAVNLLKWNSNIYLQRINTAMKENSVYKVNGSQAVKMVKDFLRYDISEGLTEFLDGEQKIKSIMVNDRTKVLENISRVEGEINKIEGLMENNPLYAASKEIKSAHSMLNNELSVLREKWNQINLEITRIDSEPVPQEDLLEDQKFNIGNYVKIKESGETGKIISVDGSSGRYTVLMDNGRTSDFMVNEITDLEEALSKAAEKNAEDAGENKSDEEGAEEMKESNNLNKSTLSVEEQKGLLKTFSDGHSFSKAPKGENDKIEMEMDTLHGYNVTMNEKNETAKAPGDSKILSGKNLNKKNLASAPGSNKMEKSKVEGEDLLSDNSPETKEKTEFDGKDAEGSKYEIGYNVREGKTESEGEMVEAPESGTAAKETHAKSDMKKKMNLAEAPGKEGDIDFEVNQEIGYNIGEGKTESEGEMVEAPESGTNAKETSAKSNIEKLMNLAEAPGKEGDIDFEVNKEIGYNIKESDEVKKN